MSMVSLSFNPLVWVLLLVWTTSIVINPISSHLSLLEVDLAWAELSKSPCTGLSGPTIPEQTRYQVKQSVTFYGPEVVAGQLLRDTLSLLKVDGHWEGQRDQAKCRYFCCKYIRFGIWTLHNHIEVLWKLATLQGLIEFARAWFV